MVVVLAGAYVVVHEKLAQGIDIEIRFHNAEGLEANKTKIRYKEVEIGEVSDISVSKDRKEVLNELVHSDLAVMPSRHPSESFGLAVLEAMACAKPVVASAVGGLPELVGDRETGLLVRPEDPTALARALDLLVEDPAMRARLGAAGLSIAKRLTVRATADAYEALFAELLA